MASSEAPFAGLFDLAGPRHGRDFNWNFFENDLNVSARRLLAHVDRLFSETAEPGWMFLTTVENDAEAGRFPDVLTSFFAAEFWSYSTRYFVAPMAQLNTEPRYDVGRLTFESKPQQLQPVLAFENGFCWGSNLSIGGVQVREEDVAELLPLNPFNRLDAARIEAKARLAWAASRDLDQLGLNVVPDEQLFAKIRSLQNTTGD